MSEQTSLFPTDSVIFSAELESGVTPFVLPDGQIAERFGLDRPPASHSAQPAKKKALRIDDTFGQRGFNSSASEDLSRSLVSRLRLKTDLLGSTLFTMTWKVRRTPSGRPIFALRALARRISANDYSSWPTPSANQFETADQEQLKKRRAECKERTKNGNGFGLTLGNAAMLAGWATPNCPNGGRVQSNEVTIRGTREDGTKAQVGLENQARLAGWATPAERDFRFANKKPFAKRGGGAKGEQLNNQVVHLAGPARLTASGEMLTGSNAQMESGGQLNPALPRWLMALPKEWCDCAVSGMASLRLSRKGLSKRISK